MVRIPPIKMVSHWGRWIRLLYQHDIICIYIYIIICIYIYNILHSYHMTIKIWVVHENYDFTSTIPCRPRHPLAPSIWHPPHRASVDLSVLPQPLTARIAGGLREQIAREARELGGTQRLQVTCWENAAFHRWKSWKYGKMVDFTSEN